jgi:hypothetical protein
MRHLGSIFLSIVSAAIIYVLTGVGVVKFATNGGAVDAGQSTNWNDVGVGVAALVIAGLLYAVLMMAPISPLGPIAAALLFIGAQVWALFDQDGIIKLLGHSVFGVDGAQEVPLTGVAVLLAVPLLATIVSPRRWRGKDKVEVVETSYPTSYAQPTTAAPVYTPTHDASAPAQTTADNAGDARIADEPIVEEPVAEEAVVEEPVVEEPVVNESSKNE